MCITWLVLATLTAIAFWKGEIFLAKDEDVVRDSLWEKEKKSNRSSEETRV